MKTAVRHLRQGALDPADRHPDIVGRVVRLVTYIRSCIGVAGERRHLVGLNDQMLRDIGISRADVSGEASRSFWDIPADRFDWR